MTEFNFHMIFIIFSLKCAFESYSLYETMKLFDFILLAVISTSLNFNSINLTLADSVSRNSTRIFNVPNNRNCSIHCTETKKTYYSECFLTNANNRKINVMFEKPKHYVENLEINCDRQDNPTNYFEYLPIWSGNTAIEKYRIINCRMLVEVTRNNFKNIENIEVFHLVKSNFKYIEFDLFNDLKKLKEINLRGNKLVTLNSKTFSHLTNLETLVVSNNELVYIPKDFLKSSKRLTKVYLENNQIEAIGNMFENYWKNKQNIEFNLNNNSCVNKTFHNEKDFHENDSECFINFGRPIDDSMKNYVRSINESMMTVLNVIQNKLSAIEINLTKAFNESLASSSNDQIKRLGQLEGKMKSTLNETSQQVVKKIISDMSNVSNELKKDMLEQLKNQNIKQENMAELIKILSDKVMNCNKILENNSVLISEMQNNLKIEIIANLSTTLILYVFVTDSCLAILIAIHYILHHH